MARSAKSEELNATYAQPLCLTAAQLITAVRFGKKEEVRAEFGMLLLNLAELAGDLGFREAAELHELSDSFEFKRR